ncbi:hypothetical protein DBR42_00950 [Pelomonas sp. HMWF004]|nr:hypothetical protein DBR42_00950 [Pelomonas sp. HMWF004]
MTYVVRLTNEAGELAGFLHRGKPVNLERATAYNSPSAAAKGLEGAPQEFVTLIQPFRQARDMQASQRYT